MEHYIDVVKHYYSINLIIFAIAFIILLIIAILTFIRKKSRKFLSAEILIMILIIFATVFYGYDLIRDIRYVKNGNVETVSFIEAGFNTKYGDDADWYSTPVVAKLTDGSELYLNNISNFPTKMQNGTITYLEKSRLILDYTGEVLKE